MSFDGDSVYECGKGVEQFHASYYEYHIYILLVMCVLGSVGNLVNMAVLTHRKMRAPIDAIFTALAISHQLILITFIPEALAHFIHRGPWSQNYYFVLYDICNVIFAEVVRLISTWLTLLLVVWGIIEVTLGLKTYLFTMRRAITISLAPFLITPIMCVPLYITFKISPTYSTPNEGNDFEELDLTDAILSHEPDLSETAKANDHLLLKLNGWIFNVALLIVPCIVLAVLNAWLIYASKKRRYENVPTALVTLGGDESEQEDETTSNGRRDTPTSLLVAMSIIFTLSVLPMGILSLLFMTQDVSFYNCAMNVHQFLHMITFIYPCVTCYLYCKMREDFWATLLLIIKPKCMCLWWPTGHRYGNDINGSSMTLLSTA